MKRWLCEVFLEADDTELLDMVADLKARFGDRVRTRSREQWLADQERNPPAPPRLVHVVVDSAGQKPRVGQKLRGRKIA